MSISNQDPFRGLHVGDGFRKRIVTYAGAASYAAGGETFSGVKGIGVIEGVIPMGLGVSGTSAVQYSYNKATGKMMAFSSGTGGAGGGTSLYTYVPGGGDIKGSANTDIAGVGSTIPTNGGLISSAAAADNTTAFTIALSPDVGRNVGIGLLNDTGGASAGNAATYTVVGTWRGAAQSEVISFTAPDLATIANGSYGYKYGVKPFDTVTSITPSAAQPANWDHVAGIGSLLGLPTDLATPIEADVTKITKNGADLAPTGLVDTTNMTVNLGTLADGADVSIQYLEDASGTGAAGEVTDGTDLSDFACDVLVLGR